MKFSLSWLKAHLQTDLSAPHIADHLTKIGIEVESVEYPGEGIRHITVARIVETQPHPHADRLKVCQVETFEGIKEVVCGAPNARAGLVTAFVAPGQVVPVSGEKLKPAVIRQVASHGMLCSAQELCLGDAFAQEGIMELDSSLKVGTSLADALGLNEAVFTVSITPNRSDWLSVHGIARDLAAAGVGTLNHPLNSHYHPLNCHSRAGGNPEASKQIPSLNEEWIPACAGMTKSEVMVQIDPTASGDCPYFVGRAIEGIQNGPSPQWLQDYLNAVGQKPINAVVDILNFILFDVGRPMHAFDASVLKGALQIRHAKPGETLLALNGKTYELTPEVLVVADGTAPQSIAGIMGGEVSGCTEQTTTVFLESAYFEPVEIAKAGRKLNLHSESRFRFERGVDPAWVVKGLDMATQLILEICGGRASAVVSAGLQPQQQKKVTLTRERLRQYAGMDIPSAPGILEKLGFEFGGGKVPVWSGQITHDDYVEVLAPTWRHDVAIEQDLIEEVLRINGYDLIPQTSLPLLPPRKVMPSNGGLARRTLAQRGLMEVATWSFIAEPIAQAFGGVDPDLKLINPISQDMAVMRPSLLPGLLTSCQRNLDRAQERVALFEVESVYQGTAISDQRLMAAGVRCGVHQSPHWAAKTRASSVYDVKADVWAVIEGLGVNVQGLRLTGGEALPAHYHPGRSTVVIGPDNKPIGFFGELHPQVAKVLSLDKVSAIFEIYLDAFAPYALKMPRSPLALNPLLPLERDFAFLVAEKTEVESLIRTAKKADRQIVAVSLFDVFAGKGVEPGWKSVALRIKIQPQGASLTDPEIKTISDAVIAAIEKTCQGKLRT
jgi:phenylalanyl-tRNA synthetase beta chain